MDIEKYCAGKKTGISGVKLHEPATLLIKWPDGFNESDGSAKPPREQGFQFADIAAMKQAALNDLQAKRDAVTKQEAIVAMFDDLLADVDEHVPQIEANLKAIRVAAEKEAARVAAEKAAQEAAEKAA